MIYWRTLANNLADGYSYASKNISSRLGGINVKSLEDMSFNDTNVMSVCVNGSGITFVPEPDRTSIVVNNCLPVDYSYNADYVIGFTYWETTRLPPSWVDHMNKCDELWTTSLWAKDAFINSGVTRPVFNFNLGIDTDIFTYKKRVYQEPFNFLHVGSPSTRKNTQLAVDAFLKLFEGDSRFKLVIKSMGPPDARRIVNGENLGGLSGHPQIEIIDKYLTDQELAELFWRVHCFIYPTRGEGWGMAPFQAIATGLPTICTNQTACTEFAYLSVPLYADMSSDNQFGIYQNGQWANPKIEDVCDKMLFVVNNYSDAADITAGGSELLHKRYSWDLVSRCYEQRLKRIVDERNREA